MRGITRVFVAIGFLLILIAYPLSILLPIEQPNIENIAVEPPEVSLGRIGDYGMYRDIFLFVRSSNPMRTALIQTAAHIDFNLLGDTPDPKRVLLGTDGWMYYRPTLEIGCDASVEDVVRNLEWLTHSLEQAGATVVLTIAPSKSSVRPQNMTPDQLELGQCAIEAGQKLRNRVASSAIEHYVDSWDTFERLEKRGIESYFKTDTHFNFIASIPWMRSLIDEVSATWNLAAVRDAGTTQWLGNLTEFAGLNVLENAELVEKIVIDRQVEVREVASEGRMSQFRSEGADPVIAGQTVILGDSFMELPRPSLVQFFANVTTLDWRDQASMQYFIEHAFEQDLIYIEVSELDVWDRFSDLSLFADLQLSE